MGGLLDECGKFILGHIRGVPAKIILENNYQKMTTFLNKKLFMHVLFLYYAYLIIFSVSFEYFKYLKMIKVPKRTTNLFVNRNLGE